MRLTRDILVLAAALGIAWASVKTCIHSGTAGPQTSTSQTTNPGKIGEK